MSIRPLAVHTREAMGHSTSLGMPVVPVVVVNRATSPVVSRRRESKSPWSIRPRYSWEVATRLLVPSGAAAGTCSSNR